jgi:hypothetical protein
LAVSGDKFCGDFVRRRKNATRKKYAGFITNLLNIRKFSSLSNFLFWHAACNYEKRETKESFREKIGRHKSKAIDDDFVSQVF